MPILRLVVEEGNQRLVSSAAWALRQLGDGITAEDMAEWLGSPVSDLRLRAVLALPPLVGREAVPQLLHALADSDSEVRAGAARQLGRLGDRSAVPFLTDTLRDSDEGVARTARFSLDLLNRNQGEMRMGCDKFVSKASLTSIHRRSGDERCAASVRGCSSESGIMVFDRKTDSGKRAPFRCYHLSTPGASTSPSTIRVFRLLDRGADKRKGMGGSGGAATECGSDVGHLFHSQETDDQVAQSGHHLRS